MLNISAVIITFNEERNIGRCLQSLQGVVREIVVVDSFSTDRTEEICRSYNVIFRQQTWMGYAEQKNFGNSLASSAYILSIDADESLSQELKQSLLNLDLSSSLVYTMNRLTNYCGSWIRHGGWYPDRKTRLFDARLAKWEGDIHEELRFSKEIAPTLLKGDLLHYSYYTLSDHLLQVEKFTNLTAEKAYQQGVKCSFWMLFMKPKWKFMRDFIFKGGFLDGYAGYLVCKVSAFATFTKYAKLKQRYTDAEK